MSGGRARKSSARTHCEQCGERLPEQLGAGRPRKKCFDCAPPAKSRSTTVATTGSRARRSAPVYIESSPVSRTAHAAVDSFGVRGQALWDEWSPRMPNPGATAALREACRLADRAERMNALICGQASAFAVLHIDDVLEEIFAMAADRGVAEVHVNLNVSSVLIEARNTASALNTIVNGLRQAVKQAGNDQAGEDDDQIAAIAKQMVARAPSSGNVVQMRQR